MTAILARDDGLHGDQSMRIGLGQFNTLTDEKLAFIKQIGVDDFQMNMLGGSGLGDGFFELDALVDLRERGEAAGLRLAAIENVPTSFYDKAMLGLPGKDEQIDNMATTIRNIGKAGIPIFGYHFIPTGVGREPDHAVLNSGATATRFELANHVDDPHERGRVFTDDEMWDNYVYMLERILPVAEEAKVKLALHPDDPPVESLGGVARIFRNFDHFKRAMDTFDSPYHGLDFCMGCWSEMGGHDNVIKAIEHFGGEKKIYYVHFRDVQGPVTCFNECYIGDGNVDTLEVMKTLKAVGFDGFMIPDHVPHTENDTDWNHRGRAHAVGYMKALLEVVNKLN